MSGLRSVGDTADPVAVEEAYVCLQDISEFSVAKEQRVEISTSCRRSLIDIANAGDALHASENRRKVIR